MTTAPMLRAPAIAIKKLAGHANVQTTMRYLHLSPTEKGRAIALLDEAVPQSANGTLAAHGKEGNGQVVVSTR